MKRIFLLPALALVAMTAFAADPSIMNTADMKWGDAPPSMPKGAKFSVLYGDPGKDGPFAVRIKMPSGYTIPPHSHSKDESLTIISGALYLGMSETVDKSKTQALKAGGFHHLTGKAHHYAFTKAPTVVQVNGEGPFDITYLNPADDPQSKK